MSLMHSPPSKDTSFIINPLIFLPQKTEESTNYHGRGERNGIYGGDGAAGRFYVGSVFLLSILPTILIFSTAAMWMCYTATSTPSFLFGDTSDSNVRPLGVSGPTSSSVFNRPPGVVTNLREVAEMEARQKVLSNTSLDIGHDLATGFGYVFGVLPTLVVIILTLIYCSRL